MQSSSSQGRAGVTDAGEYLRAIVERVRLGLWIVRQVLEAHGGRVGVESEPGVGSAFTVELPIACAEAAG